METIYVIKLVNLDLKRAEIARKPIENVIDFMETELDLTIIGNKLELQGKWLEPRPKVLVPSSESPLRLTDHFLCHSIA